MAAGVVTLAAGVVLENTNIAEGERFPTSLIRE